MAAGHQVEQAAARRSRARPRLGSSAGWLRPGFLFNRSGLLLLGIGSVWWLGVILVSLGAVLHVTASSSVRVVKLTVRLGVARPTDAEDTPSA